MPGLCLYNIFMELNVDDFFDGAGCTGLVFEVMPSFFEDGRGYFCEVLKDGAGPVPAGLEWFSSTGWIKQVNRSGSAPGTVRGCHAQKAPSCQGKLVHAVNERLYDVITDGRPDSGTFGKSKAYLLDPRKHNALWVPRGFLHAFCVPFSAASTAVFEYMCDDIYDRAAETGADPMSVIPGVVAELTDTASGGSAFGDLIDMFSREKDLLLSPKDSAAPDLSSWLDKAKNGYAGTGKAWYR